MDTSKLLSKLNLFRLLCILYWTLTIKTLQWREKEKRILELALSYRTSRYPEIRRHCYEIIGQSASSETDARQREELLHLLLKGLADGELIVVHEALQALSDNFKVAGFCKQFVELALHILKESLDNLKDGHPYYFVLADDLIQALENKDNCHPYEWWNPVAQAQQSAHYWLPKDAPRSCCNAAIKLCESGIRAKLYQ